MRQATVEDVSEQDEPRVPSPSPMNVAPASRRPHNHPKASSSRPPALTSSARRRSSHGLPVEETPFPQIRGTHLERLFFSAPEHNAKTCTVCHRRRGQDVDPSWVPSRFRGRNAHEEEQAEDDGNDDEGFAEGSEQYHHEHASTRDKGKRREHVTFSKEPLPWREQARREGLPPQTVVARVIRELEDDFTHYKG